MFAVRARNFERRTCTRYRDIGRAHIGIAVDTVCDRLDTVCRR